MKKISLITLLFSVISLVAGNGTAFALGSTPVTVVNPSTAPLPVTGSVNVGTQFMAVGKDCTTPPNLVPYADLQNCNLHNYDMSNINLYAANLTGANLCDANLSGTNLTGANLTGARLVRAFMLNANLSGANLSGANLMAYLSGANLTNATLTGANLSFAMLDGAALHGSNLQGAMFTDAKSLDKVNWGENTKCPDGTFSDVNNPSSPTCIGHLRY